MGLELLAARVLAPAMGNSIFVWGSVISSVMIALSLGYWLGGILADRVGTRSLGPVIGAAGLLTVASPLLARAVLGPAAGLGPRLGPLAASTAIFFAPSLLLAMVSPLVVRAAATRGIEHVGKAAGGLYAVSTAGSILGTLATSFWLIPVLQVEPLIVGIGMLLFVVALGTLGISAGDDRPGGAAAGIAWIAPVVGVSVIGLVAGAAVMALVTRPEPVDSAGEQVLFKRETQYHRITVTEAGGTRSLRFDKTRQTAVDVATGYESRILYPDYFHVAVAARPDARRVLVLGLGGGATTKRFWRDYPRVRVDSVDIDPVVLDVAERYFALPRDGRLRYFVGDARRYVQTTKDRYDIVVVDAYYADSLPFHLTTTEFFGEMDGVLEPGGVVVYNIISAVDGRRSDLLRSVYRTASATWDHLSLFPIGLAQDRDRAARRNIVMLATDADLTRSELLSRIGDRVDGRVTVAGFDRFGRDLYTGIVPVADVPLLTDARAPVDSLVSVD